MSPASGLNIAELETKTREDLMDIAKELGISGYSSLKKQDLIFRLLQAQTEREGNIFSGGVLEIVDDGYGFLRGESLVPGLNDVYVSQSQIRRFALRTGDYVTGQVRPPKDSESTTGCCGSRRSTASTRRSRRAGPTSRT